MHVYVCVRVFCALRFVLALLQIAGALPKAPKQYFHFLSVFQKQDQLLFLVIKKNCLILYVLNHSIFSIQYTTFESPSLFVISQSQIETHILSWSSSLQHDRCCFVVVYLYHWIRGLYTCTIIKGSVIVFGGKRLKNAIKTASELMISVCQINRNSCISGHICNY